MRYSTIALAAMPGFFSLASGLGTFTIKNSCGTDIHYVHDVDTCETVLTIPAGTSSEPCTYLTKADGSGGPSVKMALEKTICSPNPPPITQFEYTVGWAEKVFTDLSNINGVPYPFVDGGVKLTSSDNSVSVSCAAGIEDCSGAYNTPDQNEATKAAPETADLLVEVCWDKPGAYGGGDNTKATVQPDHDDNNDHKQAEAPASSPPVAPPSSTPVAPSSTPSPSSTPPPPPPAPATPSPSPSSSSSPSAVQDDAEVIITITETAPVVWVTEHVGASKKKRDRDHIHQHVHNKIHKKRHGG